MTIKRGALVVFGVLFVAALGVYLFVHNLYQRTFAKVSLGNQNECADPILAKTTTNPNKMLFISCGGFLE